jgi:hypothetical protein
VASSVFISASCCCFLLLSSRHITVHMCVQVACGSLETGVASL